MSDHVLGADGGSTVRCTACGQAYRWRVPVPMAIWLAGNLAFEAGHEQCPRWRQEWRARLLRVLDERLGQQEAEEMQRDWEEAFPSAPPKAPDAP